MRDQDLYQQILGITAPWRVAGVDLDLEHERVTVSVALEPGSLLACPQCGGAAPIYDHRERQWRHLDTCQLQTILAARVPRVECPTHGVHQIAVPWAEPGSGFTALFEALVIGWLREATTTAVARRMRLSWNAIDTMMRHAVERGLARRQTQPVSQLGVDETSFARGHDYVTVVSDAQRGCVLHVAEDRTGESLTSYYATLDAAQKDNIQSVAMDMWPAYIKATLAAVPGARAKIAFDKFHVAQHLGEAVDRVRRQEHRALQAAGDDTLKGTKWGWLRNPETMNWKQWISFKPLRGLALKTARAWAIKETAMQLWHYRLRGWAERAWLGLLGWATRSQLEPIRKVAAMLKQHLWGILNAIVLRAHNGGAESINSRIQLIKIRARGFRNKQRFITAIYFHLGGLSLYPANVPSRFTHTDR